MTLKEKSDEFWYQDFNVIFRKDRLVEFFPTEDMSMEEKLNSSVRLSIYLGLVLYFYNNNYLMLYIPICSMLGTKLLYDYYKKDTLEPNVGFETNEEDTLEDEKNRIIEIDGEKCVQPTKNNPFMNVNHIDNKNEADRPKACDISSDQIKTKVESMFMNNLYQDVSDVFGRNISSRQFYTNPSTTIPNDQESFAKWCYGDMPSCKDGQNCLRYEDLRQKRGPANEEVINQFTYNKQD